MNQNQETIEADLRGLLEGEVRCDDVFVEMFSSDASIYAIKPLGVVRPRHEDDVSACVQYAADNQLAIHARGAGTGLAGGSLGAGLVLDFSHFMRRIVDDQEETVTVQPGVTLAQLNRHLEERGRHFGPDPATHDVTTLGGMLAVDASGSHWLEYGSVRRHVESLRVVLADGSRADFSANSPIENSVPADGTSRSAQLTREIGKLLERDSAFIANHVPQTRVNNCGYCIHDVFKANRVNFPRLLVGSEGTLALIVEATLRTQPLPSYRNVALLLFDRLENAALAALEMPSMGASACDLMDRRLLTLARETNVHFDLLIPSDTEAVLLVEAEGDDLVQVRDVIDRMIDRVRRRRRLAFGARVASDAFEFELFWQLARQVVPSLYRLTGTSRPLPFIEDAAIPPETLPDFLVNVQNVLKKHHLTASVFSHAGHGQLHVRPFLDLANNDHMHKLHALASDFYEEVWQCGGTISGEHGDGLSRTPFVAQQYGPLYRTLREVKRIFDPHGVLNPGKVIGNDPHLMTANLRRVRQARSEHVAASVDNSNDQQSAEGALGSLQAGNMSLQLSWSEAELAHAARECNGCGACRSQEQQWRMCPMYRFAPREEASPRAKANLMRSMSTGRLDPSEMSGDDLKRIADLCFHCHQCRLECPATVDIPKLMMECKAQYVATNGLRPSDAFFARLEFFSKWGNLVHPVMNWAFGNRQMRWLLEKMCGLAQGRKLPRFARRPFTRLASRRRLTRASRGAGRKVLYFVDIYANWFDVQLAETFVAVLEHNGVGVYVHPDQRQSGMSMISLGIVDKARKVAAENVALLAEAIRQGYHIVTTEPSAALCLTHEYLNLLDDDDARLVAENTSEACDYLWKLHQTSQLRLDMKPISATVGYHAPCHMKALQNGTPGANLLRLIPSLTVRHVDAGCSGMAGTFGFKRENYRTSLRSGWGLITALRDPDLQVGTTECSSCKIQMEQGTTKPTIHPIKLLALAYGLAPEVVALMNARGDELIVT